MPSLTVLFDPHLLALKVQNTGELQDKSHIRRYLSVAYE